MSSDETTTMEPKLREAAYSYFVGRCWSDPAFKQRFLAEPKAVICETGADLPAGLAIEVIEEGAGQMHLVLPPQSEVPQGALSAEAASDLARDFNFTEGKVAIVARALQKPDFRTQLAADPRGAIGKEFGEELPPGLEVKLFQDDATTSYFILPLPPTSDEELDEAELEAVAGGVKMKNMKGWRYGGGPLAGTREMDYAATWVGENVNKGIKKIFSGW